MTRRRLIGPLAGLVLLFLLAVSAGLWNLVAAANQIENDRSRAALAMAIEAQLDRLVALADDGAFRDDAAEAVYATAPDRGFVWRNWGIATADGRNFHYAAIVDGAGRARMSFRDGRTDQVSPAMRLGPGFNAVAQSIEREGRSKGVLIRSGSDLWLAGIATITPPGRDYGESDAPPRALLLVLAKRVDEDLLSALGRRLLLTDLATGAASGGREQLDLPVAGGGPAVSFNWKAANSGTSALWLALPVVLTAIFAHLMVAALAVAQGARFVRELTDRARIDGLSGLPNRNAMRNALSRRLEGGAPVVLAMIDLDGFKQVNDNFGHAAGDRLIKVAADEIVALAPAGAVAARLGGDEFAVVFAGAQARADAEAMANAVIGRFSRPFRIESRSVRVGASIGLAQAELAGESASELMRRADMAMYAAKESGKMQLCWYLPALDEARTQRRAMEAELREALANQEFLLEYQPLFDVASGEVVSVEALLRWNSPRRGNLGPGEFLAVAEEFGLMDEIGSWAFKQLCRDARKWPAITLAFNLSQSQLRNAGLAQQLAANLKANRFPAERIEIEVTERALLDHPDVTWRMLEELRATGMGVVLESFGTGYASISLLRRFPFAKIKLDKGLVAEAVESETARTVLQASVNIGRAMNMAVAASGVESAAQADLLRIAGCTHVQGWHYSRPLPAKELTALLARPPKQVPAVRRKTRAGS